MSIQLEALVPYDWLKSENQVQYVDEFLFEDNHVGQMIIRTSSRPTHQFFPSVSSPLFAFGTTDEIG